MRPCFHSAAARGWTLTSLVGSYVDLALAYLLLLGSTVVWFASRLLSLFGLDLPCPCAAGLFGRPAGEALLLHSTRARIESVHGAVRGRFPFDLVLGLEAESTPLRLTGPEGDGDGDGEEEGPVNRVAPVVGVRIRRRRVSGWRKGKSPAAAAAVVSPVRRLSWLQEEEEVEPAQEPDRNLVAVADEGAITVAEAFSPATDYYSVDEASPAAMSNDNLEMKVENLERELKEARAARAVLHSELEKERNAAATAAEEAMNMILRLQSEKAAMAMESRQYQRLIEEKSAYDEEEMEVLKEIIVRREREKHVLEKEVVAYRQMLSGDVAGEKAHSLSESSDDPTLMLKTICDSIKKKEKLSSKMKWTDHDMPMLGEEFHMEFQEKGMLTVDIYPSGDYQSSRCNAEAIRCTSEGHQGLGCHGGPTYLSAEGAAEGASKVERRISFDELDREEHDEDLSGGGESSQYETESSILDVHVVEDKQNLQNATTSGTVNLVSASEMPTENIEADAFLSTIDSADFSVKTPVTNCPNLDQDIQRSLSDMTADCLAMDNFRANAPHFDLRRSSMSEVDSERFRLETEVDYLRKRLKAIQHGRENLNFSTDFKEKEAFQFQLLDEIAHQLEQIKKISEPGKRMRQTSLPPLSPKARSKKKRCRSVSSGLYESV